MDNATLNRIPERQNQPEQIKLLRAQRYEYGRAKQLLALSFLVSVVLPVISSVAGRVWPELKASVAAASLVVVFLQLCVLDRASRRIRRHAARIQEEFDCVVLELDWNEFAVGERVDKECVHGAAIRANGDEAKLLNWYPEKVGVLPLHMARLLCQRTNLWYDGQLRRRYAGLSLAFGIGLASVLFIAGVLQNMPIDEFVLVVLSPLAPILVWCTNEFLRQTDSAASSDRAKAFAHELWNRAIGGGCSADECSGESRSFQNAIYDRRCDSPVIPSWVYRLMRPRLEEQMRSGIADMIKEATDGPRSV